MEFRVLGPVEVEKAGCVLVLGGPKPRALLAILLLQRGEVVRAERLVELLYDGLPPEKASKSVQAHVSRLRKALGDGRLRTAGGGYALDVSPDELDLGRFEQLVERGRAALAASEPEPAATSLREALALWRGPPYADFRYHDFAQVEIARLEERRLAVLEDRVEADLALGRHADLVSELEALVREHPLRERARAQFMLALYRSRRQAEALAAYQDARRALTEELGIEPSAELRELQQAILEQSATLDLGRGQEPERTPRLSAGEGSRSQEPRNERRERPARKTVTVVHVRLTPTSTSGDKLDPEVLRRVLGRALGEITAAVESHEGTLAVVATDSVTAVFGMPTVHEDDASRAMRAAEEIHRRLVEVARKLEGESNSVATRIGVSTGEVMTGEWPGSPFGVTGAPLTTAAALAQSAEPATLVADDATLRAASSRREDGRFISPMVGRTRERRRLNDVFEQAVSDRSCQLFTILGVAGVGKSRLVREFLQDIEQHAFVARGRCLPYGDGITFWPLVEAIKELIGADSTPEVSQADIAALIDGADEASLVAQRVSEAIGLVETTGGIEEGFDAVRTFLEALAARRPLVVVFDDVHWGEPTFHDLIEYLADWSRGAPIFLLCLARPELLDVRAAWGGGKLNATSVLLEPLSDSECTELLANLVGEAELAEEVEARIAAAAEGNPLYVEEMLSMLIDEGVLVRDDRRWVTARALTAVPVPPTIQALLAARLDQMGMEERSAVEAAAVEGKVFHESSVIKLAPRVDAPAALASLVRKEVVRPDRAVFAGERAFRFRHLLIRDAAYDSIPKEMRAVLHEQHVEWLEEMMGARTVEFDEIVGYHLEQAVRYRAELGHHDHATRALSRRAAELLGSAGRRAFARSDAPAGLKLISRAVALLSPEDSLRVELIPNVRVVQGMEDLSWADRVLTEAVEASATTGDRRLAAHALVQRALLRLFTASELNADELVKVADQVIRAFEDLGDELGLTRGWRLIAQARYLAGQAERCVEASERAFVHARRAGDTFEEREIAEWLGIALVLGPHPADHMEEICERLVEQVRGQPALEVQFLGTLAYAAGIQGKLGRFSELMQAADDLVDVSSEWIWLVPVHFAWIALARAQPAAAEHALRSDYEKLKRLGEKSHFCSYASVLGQAVYDLGRYDEAEALAREAMTAARANDVHTSIIVRGTIAKVLARRGDIVAAERLVHEAVAFADASDFLQSRADALTDMAEILALAGKTEESARALDRAVAFHEQKGNVLAVQTLRARVVSPG